MTISVAPFSGFIRVIIGDRFYTKTYTKKMMLELALRCLEIAKDMPDDPVVR